MTKVQASGHNNHRQQLEREVIAMATSKTSEPTYKVVMEKDVAMRTRDGVTLRADVYRPDASGKFPVLVVRTPYDKSAGMAATEKDYFPPRGYVVVMQDTRGRHASEGEFTPFVNERRDGSDAIEWRGRHGGAVVHGAGAVLRRSRAPAASEGDEPGLRANHLLREFHVPARRVRDRLGARVLHFHGARHADAQGALRTGARQARQLRQLSGYPDGAAQARRVQASAVGGLGRASQARRAVSCRLHTQFELRAVLGRD